MRGLIEFVLFWIVISPIIYAAHLMRVWADGDVVLVAAIVIPWLVALFTVGVLIDIRQGRYQFRTALRYPGKVADSLGWKRKRG